MPMYENLVKSALNTNQAIQFVKEFWVALYGLHWKLNANYVIVWFNWNEKPIKEKNTS